MNPIDIIAEYYDPSSKAFEKTKHFFVKSFCKSHKVPIVRGMVPVNNHNIQRSWIEIVKINPGRKVLTHALMIV